MHHTKKETLFRTSLSLVPKSLTWVITQNPLSLMCLYVCILYCDVFNGVKMPGTLLSHGWTVYWIILVLARCTYQEYHLDVSMDIQIQDHVLKPLVFFFLWKQVLRFIYAKAQMANKGNFEVFIHQLIAGSYRNNLTKVLFSCLF